jgi:hypothetical protein
VFVLWQEGEPESSDQSIGLIWMANWVISVLFFILMNLIYLVFSLIHGWYHAEKGSDLHGVCSSFGLLTGLNLRIPVNLTSDSDRT